MTKPPEFYALLTDFAQIPVIQPATFATVIDASETSE